MSPLTIVVGEDYIPDLQKRMEKYGISAAELARELEKTEQEISRWFNSKRRFGKQWTPRMSNILKIEQAIIDIRRRKARRSTPAKGAKKV